VVIPAIKEFLEMVKTGGIPPLYEEIPFSSPYAVYAYLQSKNSFLLESIKGPEKIARYSFVGFDPCLVFRVKNGIVENSLSPNRPVYSRKPLREIKDIMKLYHQSAFDHLPPFQGGLAGILSYDFVRYIEKIPSNSPDDLNLPDAHFMVTDKLAAFDHLLRKAWLIVCPGLMDSLQAKDERINWAEKFDEAVEKMQEIKSLLRDPKSGTDELLFCNHASPLRLSTINYEMKQKDYMDIVKRTKEYIAAGDIFQANLSQRVSAHIGSKSPWNLYGILRSINPAPFAAFFDFGDYQIVSSSPERLVRTKGAIIDTRPIAGTRPRGRDATEDEFMRRELLLNEKERAEHIMLIDLERNDLGRVSEYGSVRVDELMITEDCSHVIHIVSNVTGNLACGKDCFDGVRAVFPGGTITGVPKVRCMEIIDELEPVRRGPYTGSVGYIGFSGNMDLNIIIRTFVVKNEMAYVQAGAGIVADSDPEKEYFETLKKAQALIKTLELI
jgi:anthranilate/para-aminobenzoate synthase component I